MKSGFEGTDADLGCRNGGRERIHVMMLQYSMSLLLISLRSTSFHVILGLSLLSLSFTLLFCLEGAVLCATIVHSAMHTYMNRPNSSLDWVLSQWAHFTVLRFIFVYVCILCITVYCMF